MIRSAPVKFDIDDGVDLVANVEMFDECTATVTMTYCTNLADWDLVSAAIRSALVAMELEV